MALALVGTLIASLGVVLMGATGAGAVPGQVCPSTDGWVKTDGELERLSYTIGPFQDGALITDVCAYSGSSRIYQSLDPAVSSYTVTSGEGPWQFLNAQGVAQNLSHVAWKVRPAGTRDLPPAPVPTERDCDTDGSLTLPSTPNATWSIVKDGDGEPGTSPYGPGTYDVTVTSTNGIPFDDGSASGALSYTFQDIVVLPATGGCGSRTLPAAPTPATPTCSTDGSLTLPADGNGLTWSIVPVAPTTDVQSPYGPGTYTVTVVSSTLPFEGDDHTYTYPSITVLGKTGPPCGDTTTTRNVSDERISCELGVERRSGTVTTINGQVQPTQWGQWQVVRGLNDAEFEANGCRPDQPEPAEVLGSETRMNCVGLQQRSSSQVTTFVWNASTREYETVVGDTVWSDWKTLRKLTAAERKAEGCVLGEETLVPTPKPDKKPTVKGVERVAPPATVPTAVAAGALGASPSATTQLLAQLLMGGGMLLLLAGGWIGFGRREGGAHEA